MPISRGNKVFYGVILAAALLIGVLGYFAPVNLASIASWLVLPPLHARFVGALYFYGAIFMLGCLMARTQAEVRFALPMIATWTGLLFVVSILSLNAFDFSRAPAWIWFASYLIYPLIAIGLTWAQRQQPDQPPSGSPLPGWAQGFLKVQGVIIGVFAIVLIIFPGLAIAVWPWKLTPLLAQTYGGPLLAYAIGSWWFGGRQTWLWVRAVVPAMLVFTAGVLVASFMHRDLFSSAEVSDWVWFIAFGVATTFLGAMTVRVLTLDRTI